MTDWIALEQKYFIQVARRQPIVLVRGAGCRVWDADGREYLDFIAGWAVDALGHGHHAVLTALREQAEQLILASNAYYTVPQIELAQYLVEHTALDRAFFQSSGAEANEGAVKLARKWGRVNKGGAYEVITTLHSFHGRTLAMVAATGKPAYQEPFEPLPEGFVNVEWGSVDAIAHAASDRTCAVMLEPVQGEGGVHVGSPEYLRAVREWCDENRVLLIFDEVQTGVGRTGKLWGYEHSGVRPDIMTVAKGLGGGVPIGGFLAREEVAAAFVPGDHGTTFGGNPLCTAVALAVVRYVVENDLPAHVARAGEHLMTQLRGLAGRHPEIQEVRGLGLLVAVQLDREVSNAVVDAARERGLLLNPVTPDAVRVMPPLIVGIAEIDEAIEKLDAALTAVLRTTESGAAI